MNANLENTKSFTTEDTEALRRKKLQDGKIKATNGRALRPKLILRVLPKSAAICEICG